MAEGHRHHCLMEGCSIYIGTASAIYTNRGVIHIYTYIHIHIHILTVIVFAVRHRAV